jgi:hypothetical protein
MFGGMSGDGNEQQEAGDAEKNFHAQRIAHC